MSRSVLEGIRAGRPPTGPRTVHVDLTNGCNARCLPCWDHSPLLREPRPAAWKRVRLDLGRFLSLVEDLDALGSVDALILSGMGEPLTHPDIWTMLDAVRERGWALTLISNLVAPGAERLARHPPTRILAGLHAATPATYAELHPGWDESQFFTAVRVLRALATVPVRHVHVICEPNARELPAMVRLGALLGADRVNLKLASLAGGTEAVELAPATRTWLAEEGLPRARAEARDRGVRTTLDLLERQLAAGPGATIELDACYMGYAYARVTAEGEVLYCCNTQVRVGNLDQASFGELWRGRRWQALRERIGAGHLFPGCERCGKYEQNLDLARRLESP